MSRTGRSIVTLGPPAGAILNLFRSRSTLTSVDAREALPQYNQPQLRNALNRLKEKRLIEVVDTCSRGRGLPLNIYRRVEQDVEIRIQRRRQRRPAHMTNIPRPGPEIAREQSNLPPLVTNKDRKIALLRRKISDMGPGIDRDIMIGILIDYGVKY